MRLRATPEPGLRPGTDVGGFQIEKKLGMGAFGTVYRARRKKRVYALKLIARSGAGAWAEREVGVLLQLQHPHVARITSCGYWPEEEQLFFYVVTELVAGQPLDEWARRVRPTARLVARLVLTLARTLEEVHAAGVVHRDVKPVNILVREEDGQPVLVDFGAGGYENAPRLTVLLPPGTPEYRSPEALRFVRGEATDDEDHYQPRPSDDLWALGVVLYWLLTGELPFGDRSKADLHDAIRHRAPEPPHERNPRVPPALGQVCLRMLEKEPRARCKDAVEVGSALVAALAGADADWDVPLEAGWHSDAETELATSLPARESDTLTPLRALLPSRGPRLVLAGLVLFLSAFGLYRAVGNASPSAEVASAPLPNTSVSPLPPSWGRAVQEVAKEEPTPEVDAGAALPEEQPTPAPVAQATHEKEDRRVRLPEKKKRQQKQNGDVDAGTGPLRALQETVGRTVKAAGAAACLGAAACASGPAARSSPPPEECPAGTIDATSPLGVGPGVYCLDAVFAPSGTYDPYLGMGDRTVREGPMMLHSIDRCGGFPVDTEWFGYIYFREGKVYGRFTKARLPDGRTLPVCMDLIGPKVRRDFERGTPIYGPIKDGEAVVHSNANLQAVWRFED